MLVVIRIRGVAAIGNISSIGLNGLMFGTIESGRIIGTDRRLAVAATRRCAAIAILPSLANVCIKDPVFVRQLLYFVAIAESGNMARKSGPARLINNSDWHIAFKQKFGEQHLSAYC